MKKISKYLSTLGCTALLFLLSAVSFPLCAKAAPQDTVSSAEQYALIFDPAYYTAANPDVAAAFGSDANLLFQHFLTTGIAEGRQGSASFNVYSYAANNPDLVVVFGPDLPAYYKHYITSGFAEGRSATGSPSASVQPVSEQTTQTKSTDPTIGEVHTLVNQYRQENDCSALSLSDDLNKAANIRATELEQSFSHTRPDGSECFSAMKSLGISYGWAGENIAKGQRSSSQVMTAWMNSPGHRANILNTHFHKIGIGHFTTGNGIQCWVQLFSD
ncbi:MAG: hypothetical protein GX234_03390 [Clostridiales bacterium]|nr:hypothetical protein [Clostridiales bacterium]